MFSSPVEALVLLTIISCGSSIPEDGEFPAKNHVWFGTLKNVMHVMGSKLFIESALTSPQMSSENQALTCY